VRKTTVGASAVAAALIASLALASGGTATATTTTAAAPAAAPSTTAGQGLTQTNLPVAVDPAADLAPTADRQNESWYVTAHVVAGGHRYGLLAHYLNVGDAKQGRAISAVSITDEDTGWYTKSNVVLPAWSGLSGDKPGLNIHTDNITWTGDTKEQKLHAKVPEGTIDVTLRPQGNVLYNGGTGYFPMFGDTKYPNYEYAFPSTYTSGTLTLKGRTVKVRGEAWLDRQWGPLPNFTTVNASWTWMNINLSNGDKISLWKTKGEKENTWVTVQKPDGTETYAEATVTPDESTLWTSPDSGKTYPTRWKVTIPGEHANLNVKVYAKNQELVQGRLEGSAGITGSYGHRPVTGSTYIEVTGR